jgi:hypothetical protein
MASSADFDNLAALRAENARRIGLLDAHGIAWRTTTAAGTNKGQAAGRRQ